MLGSEVQRGLLISRKNNGIFYDDSYGSEQDFHDLGNERIDESGSFNR